MVAVLLPGTGSLGEAALMVPCWTRLPPAPPV